MSRLPLRPQCVEKPKLMLEGLAVLLLFVTMAPPGCQKAPDTTTQSPDSAKQSDSDPTVASGLPRLVDLGANNCIPCKKMAPFLDELDKEYAGSLEVVFIDVWQDRSAGLKYGIQSIPTQIFYDSSGKELFRHMGFFAKPDILAKWKELGVDLQKKPPESSPNT